MSVHVLLVDDDQVLAHDLRCAFVSEGYQLDHALQLSQAIRQLVRDAPDAIVLGVKPDRTGWKNCCQLLAFVEQPVLLLLSSTDTQDRIKGLAVGADDCITQPIRASEVVARVEALLRRMGPRTSRPERDFFTDRDLVIDLMRQEVWLDGHLVALTPTEFRLLSFFVEHVGEVLSPEYLALQIWEGSQARHHAAIKQYIYRLRRKLEPLPSSPQRILSLRGRGYMFASQADMQRDL